MLFDGREVQGHPSPPRSDRDRRRSVRWIVIFFVGMLTVAVFVSPNPVSVAVSDQVTVFVHPPSAAVTSLAVDADLTDAGRTLFYASTPALEPRAVLAVSCSDDSVEVYGCYDQSDGSIHLLIDDDPRSIAMSAGIAAHEMLHAVWDRLSDSERATLTSILRSEWELRRTDPLFADRMSYYSELDEAGFTDELHSVFATEVARLPVALEQHYAEYLADRPGLAAGTSSAMYTVSG